MSFFCIGIAYTLRVALNIAITQMVVKNNHSIVDPDDCPDPESSTEGGGNSPNVRLIK